MSDACGRGFTLLVTEAGRMVSFGVNSNAQLGCGSLDSQMLPNFTCDKARFGGQELVIVAAGEEHSAAVTRTGDLWTWGNAKYGRLGIDFSTESPDETREMATERRRKLDVLMISYPITPIQVHWPERIPSSVFQFSPVIMVTCGHYFTLSLTQAGHVWQCGSSDANGHVRTSALIHRVQASAVFQQVDFPALFDAGTKRSTKIVMIASGYRHMMALDETGLLWMWGKNMHGELGLGYTASNEVSKPTAISPSVFQGLGVKSMDGGLYYSMIITTDDNLWACGLGGYGALGIGPTRDVLVPRWVGGADEFGGEGVRMVACGGMHTLIVTHENKVWSCGSRDSMALGLPLLDVDYNRPTLIPHHDDFQNENIVMAAAGLRHSLVVTESGAVYTWGRSTKIGGGRSTSMVSPLGHYVANHNNANIVRFPRLLVFSFTTCNGHIKTVPTPVRCGLWHRRCWLDTNEEAALAFAMATHMHLCSHGGNRDLSKELVQSILVDAMQFQPK